MDEPKHINKILRLLKSKPEGMHQSKIVEELNINQCYVSTALKYLMQQGSVFGENRLDKSKNGARIWRKYYSAAQQDENGTERPASSVMSR